MHLTAGTVDDLMRTGIRTVKRRGTAATPKKGQSRELYGCTFTLSNPRARLSRSAGRGLIFSPLGELAWYLSGSNRTNEIAYYIPEYVKYDEDGIINGAYGPRMFNFEGIDQLKYVIDKLTESPSSRQVVIQLFDRNDVVQKHLDVPCTCTLQFLVRGSKLAMVTHMRSNDAWKGFPHDIFCLTMLQEIVARSLGVEISEYIHMVGSYHLYKCDERQAADFIDEGWQSTSDNMPAMPLGDPWISIGKFLEHEKLCRTSEPIASDRSATDPYWADLADCLAIFGLIKRHRIPEAKLLSEEIHYEYFKLYINQRLGWV